MFWFFYEILAKIILTDANVNGYYNTFGYEQSEKNL